MVAPLGLRRDVRKQATTVELRAASGSLTAGETSTALTTIGGYEAVSIVLDVTTLTLADADDEVDFYIQTTYDNGTTWTDIQNVHFTTADNGTTPRSILHIDDRRDGPGTIQSITGTDPAAGTEVSETVPANTIWSLNSVRANFITDATVASRFPALQLTDGTDVLSRYLNAIAQTASQTLDHDFKNISVEHASRNSTMNHITNFPVILSAGYIIETSTVLIKAGDNWGAPQLLVEAWHDPLAATDGSIGDNLKSYDRPLGSQIRIKTTVAGASAPTYAYNATAFFK